MSRLDFEAAEYGKGKNGLENYFMEFPNMIETEGMEDATDITQVKIYETNHFFEVKVGPIGSRGKTSD